LTPLGLGELDDAGYIAAMQAINDRIPNGLFVVSFAGAPVLLLAATALHARARSPRLAPLALATVLVVAGGLCVTFFANVPLNDELATVRPTAPPDVLAQARAGYEDAWNAWNTVRVLTCTAALACAGWALRRPAERNAARAATRAGRRGPIVAARA
jgi:uncharacterized membrane protein